MSLLPKGGMSRGGSGGLLSRLQNRRGGLLGTNPLTYMGLGLLSQGPSLTPQSPWQGLGVGLGMYGAMQDRLATQDFRQAKMDLEREKLEDARAQREAEAGQAERQRAAQVQRLIAGGMAPDQAANVVAAGSFDKFSGPATPEKLHAVVGPDGRPTLVPRSEAVGMEPSRVSPVSLTMGAGAYEPQTGIGKLYADLAHAENLPPGEDRDAQIASLRAKIAKETQPPSEVFEREGKYATAYDAAMRFNELADEYGASTGPIAGRASRAMADIGASTEQEATLRALEATMKTQLGTALSGAAIPESEWPNYMAQLPSMQDSPEVRKGKMAALQGTMTYLEGLAAKRRGEPAPAPAQTAPLPNDVPVGTAPPQALPAAPEVQRPEGFTQEEWDMLQELRGKQGG